MQLYLAIQAAKNAPFPLLDGGVVVSVFIYQCPITAFTLTVTQTDETCPGNGSLTFAVSGNDPAATMTYTVYELPNTVTPITVQTANSISGLTQGDYQVFRHYQNPLPPTPTPKHNKSISTPTQDFGLHHRQQSR